MHAHELWTSKAPGARLARAALTPASWLYAFGWQTYLATYRLGFKQAAAPHHPVVCVGNLQAGGSGKSPMTLHLARLLREGGYEVVVSLSGYGAPHAEAAALAPEGPLSAREWGDEPAMVRLLAPDLPLVVGRRRVLAAEIVHRECPNAVMLMDDGFQHLPLRKDLTLVLDPERPANARCLPAGPYREPRRNRRRADLVLPGEFRIVNEPTRLLTPEGEEERPTRYDLLCALGQPERFVSSVTTALGHAPEVTRLLSDHDPLDAGTLFDGLSPERPLVVTVKDWVKLRERADVASRRVLIATHAVRIEPEAAFRTWLFKRVDGESAT